MRGLNGEMYGAFNDVLDYGKRILDAHRQWYVDRRLPALVNAGIDPMTAQAQVQSEAAAPLKEWITGFPISGRGIKRSPCATRRTMWSNFALSPM